MSTPMHSSIWKIKLAIVLALGIFGAMPAVAQTPANWDRSAENRTQAIDPSRSRAAQAADELVSLSAEKIIALLRNETGLMLQVKKLLVQKAYEQGRVVDSQDLTDESIFKMVREDEQARVIITREIEDRHYVNVKPRKEELEHGQVLESLRKPGEAAPSLSLEPASRESGGYLLGDPQTCAREFSRRWTCQRP